MVNNTKGYGTITRNMERDSGCFLMVHLEKEHFRTEKKTALASIHSKMERKKNRYGKKMSFKVLQRLNEKPNHVHCLILSIYSLFSYLK
jgi:hypothetical protein